MNEQQLAQRFQAAVEVEPPLGFDPDEVINRVVLRQRRRRLVLASASAVAKALAAHLPQIRFDPPVSGGTPPPTARCTPPTRWLATRTALWPSTAIQPAPGVTTLPVNQQRLTAMATDLRLTF